MYIVWISILRCNTYISTPQKSFIHMQGMSIYVDAPMHAHSQKKFPFQEYQGTHNRNGS